MDDFINSLLKKVVQCMYCEEWFDINTKICNDKTCEFSDREHHDAVEDYLYDELLDHMDVCKVKYKVRGN